MTYRPRKFEQVDRVIATAPTTGMTLTGLLSETDGIYMLQGRIKGLVNGVIELRPDGVIQTAIASEWKQDGEVSLGTTFTSTSGWICAGGLSSDASMNWDNFFTAWIWPSAARSGGPQAGGPRFYRMVGTQRDNTGGARNRMDAWGDWNDGAVASWSSLLVGGFGSTMETGSEVILYRMVYD